MVGDTGIEPVTPSMSTKCSTAELIARMADAVVIRPKKRGAENRAGERSIKGVETGIKGFWKRIKSVYVLCNKDW